eukprot:TRINITY_DN11631_c1_g1_i2.p1 TRINITY_DN11631_c1_g1~~TRINITY_DN11631_c1_g1_i2.p1  ORF type:complete len:723 (+),score=9.76 TRINITY_DN11631_c1_g1_i2:110-2170(+)
MKERKTWILQFLTLSILQVQAVNNLQNNNCPPLVDNCTQCFRLLVIWEPYNRLLLYSSLPFVGEVRQQLMCIFPENAYGINGTVLELWDKEIEGYYEINDNTQLSNNSKVNVKVIHSTFAPTKTQIEFSFLRGEMSLRKTLLKDYDSSLWPWKDKNSSCKVHAHISFQKLLDMNLARRVLSMQIWFRLRWQDPRFVWDPSQWNDTNFLYLDKGEFWDPYIEIWDSADSIYDALEYQRAQVNSSGHIFWSRGGQVNIQCNMEGFERFPYDNSHCKIQLGSWVHNMDYVELSYYGDGYKIYESKTSDKYSKFSQYSIVNVTVNVTTYGQNELDTLQQQNYAPWNILIYDVVFKRHPLPYTISVVIPQGLLVSVSFLAFWISPASGERLGYSVTLTLAVSVYNLLLYQVLPASQELAYILWFSFITFIFAMIVVIESAIVVMLWYRTEPYLFSLWKSIKKAFIDLQEVSAWVDIMRALDTEIIKYNVTIYGPQWKKQLLLLVQKTWEFIRHLQLIYRKKNSHNLEASNEGQMLDCEIELSPLTQSGISAQVLMKDCSDRDGLTNSSYQKDQQSMQLKNYIFPSIDQEDAMSVDQAREFLDATLAQPQYQQAYNQYQKLISSQSKFKVQQKLLQIMELVDSSTIETMYQKSEQKYNKRWRKLGNFIDRIAQFTVIPSFLIFVVVSIIYVS